jgi:hypothetical protein
VSEEGDGSVKPPKEVIKRKRRHGKPLPHLRERKKKHREALKELNVHVPARASRARDVEAMRLLKDMLRETWVQLKDKAQAYHRFSEKQIKFARQYAINGRRNIAEACRVAGYEMTHDVNFNNHGRKLLRIQGMEELIQAFELEEKARMKINVDDVVTWFHKIATAAMDSEDYTNANRAMESLAKYLGMFVERKEITHKTVHSREELDVRIAEYQRILSEGRSEIDAKLTIN